MSIYYEPDRLKTYR